MGRSKLSDADRKEIRRSYEAGEYTQLALAKKYNVSKQTIIRVINPAYAEKSNKRANEYRKENNDRIYATQSQMRRRFTLSYHVEKDAEVVKKLDDMIAAEQLQDYVRNLVINDIHGAEPNNVNSESQEETSGDAAKNDASAAQEEAAPVAPEAVDTRS